MKPILEIQNISKQFFIDHENMPYYSFRDRLGSLFKPKPKREEFWALQNVSFNVLSGESIGIIGRNGAGKSTLLKILSKITPPTKGKIISRGRIASLLEVGTGFHQELTGRENIFMNGSILGMKRAEIKSRFDEIIDFSGVEKFLDTPLKHYSSGMQLRLAFAVAAHLEPEILIIDEVLAVGDAVFQKKCLGKMEDVNKSGRTILFVSHNLSIIQQLCKKTIWMDEGKVNSIGNTSQVVDKYLMIDQDKEVTKTDYELTPGLILKNIKTDRQTIESVQDFLIEFQLSSEKPMKVESIGLFVNNLFEERMGIFDLREYISQSQIDNQIKFRIKVHRNPLIEGTYTLGLFLGSDLARGNFPNLLTFQVLSGNKENDFVPYPVEVRGKMEFDFNYEKN